MPGDYSTEELQSMSAGELMSAQTRGFRKPLLAAPGDSDDAASKRTEQPVDSANVWARNKKSKGKDFTCPSGQTCRLKPLSIEGLMIEGILDQVTRLEGLAQQLIDRAEGQPPAKQKMPDRKDLQDLLQLVNKVVPLAVAEPAVFQDNDLTAPQDCIRISDIDLEDRIAILNESLKGLKNLDNFRPAG